MSLERRPIAELAQGPRNRIFDGDDLAGLSNPVGDVIHAVLVPDVMPEPPWKPAARINGCERRRCATTETSVLITDQKDIRLMDSAGFK